MADTLAALPEGTRLILAAEDLLPQFGSRTEDGYRITAEWGEQRPEGWYEPLFTIHYDQPLAAPPSAPAAPLGPRSMESVRNWLGLDLWLALGHDFTDWTGWDADVWADMIAEVRAALALTPEEADHD